MSVDPVSGLSSGCSLVAGSDTSIRRNRHRRGPLGLWRVAIALPVAACSYSPTMDLLGSYFPAWMLCALLGIALAIAVRVASVVTGLGRASPPLLYPLLAMLFTAAGWILFFRG